MKIRKYERPNDSQGSVVERRMTGKTKKFRWLIARKIKDLELQDIPSFIYSITTITACHKYNYSVKYSIEMWCFVKLFLVDMLAIWEKTNRKSVDWYVCLLDLRELREGIDCPYPGP